MFIIPLHNLVNEIYESYRFQYLLASAKMSGIVRFCTSALDAYFLFTGFQLRFGRFFCFVDFIAMMRILLPKGRLLTPSQSTVLPLSSIFCLLHGIFFDIHKSCIANCVFNLLSPWPAED